MTAQANGSDLDAISNPMEEIDGEQNNVDIKSRI